MRIVAWLSVGSLVMAAAGESLPHSLKSLPYGFEIRYPSDWEEQPADSDVVTYYAAEPLPPIPGGAPNSRFVLAGPERDGFRATLNVQPRNSLGALDERSRRETVRGIQAMAERVPGASVEMVDDRMQDLPAGRALVVDYRFSNAQGRRLSARQWVLSGEITYLISYTDTLEGFERGRDLIDAMIGSLAIFEPPPPASYEEITNLWVTVALLISLLAGGTAYILYRRAQKVEEYRDGEPTVPDATAPSGGA